MFKTALATLAFAAFVPLGAGCDDGTSVTPTGGLEVTYRVGSGTSSCADVGIAFVRVHIGMTETTDLLHETFPCDPAAQLVAFVGVDVGTYTIRVEGLDAGTNVIYRGEGALPVSVVADRTNGPVNVVLDQLRPSMEIFFGFGDVGGCGRFGVVDILVRVYENGSSIVHDASHDCATQINESLVIENLSGTSTYDLRVRGTNEFGEGTYQYNRDAIIVAPGAPAEISAELAPCTGVCPAP